MKKIKVKNTTTHTTMYIYSNDVVPEIQIFNAGGSKDQVRHE